MTTLSRRQLAAIALGSTAVALAHGQATPPPQAIDFLQAARDSKQEAAEELANFELALSVEPAFQFKA